MIEYLGLFVSSFVAATLIPAGSELVVSGLLLHHPERLWPVLGVATLGNTLGGLTSYGLGRLIPMGAASEAGSEVHRRISPRAQRLLRQYGLYTLLLSWLPVIGDGLCVGAGWLRLPLGRSALAIGLGKFLRYAVLAWTVLALR